MVIEKAAERLGVDPTTLRDALVQARQDMMLERLNERLAKAVTNGTVTREEADAIKAWIDARPAAVEKLGRGMFGLPGLLGRGHHGPRGFGGHGFHGMGKNKVPGDTEQSTESPTTSGQNL